MEEGFILQCMGCWAVEYGPTIEIANLTYILKGMEMEMTKKIRGIVSDDKEGGKNGTFGSEFHSRGADSEKVLSPYRLRDGGTYKSLFEVERNTLVDLCSSRSAYDGANPCCARNANSAIEY